jgi:hypothetical protein
MTDKATEAVARAIAIEMYGSAIAIVGGSTDEWKPAHMAVMPIAEAAISTYKQHLADGGMAHIEQLEALLKEAASDIEGEANMRWPTRHIFERGMRGYNRDMDLPNRIRAALIAGGE